MPITSFIESLGGIAFSTEKDDLVYYGQDTCHHFSGRAAAVLFPTSTDEVVSCINLARTHRLPIVPSGGRTGYSGGATATEGEIVLSVKRLNRVLEVDPIAGSLTAEAGVTIETIQQRALETGLIYPVDFGSRDSAHLGGSIATNAGGMRVVRYGMTRAHVLALTVVTGTGEVLKLGGKLYKNNTGLDLMQLFIGSEGILGVITEATVRLAPKPPETICACLALNSDADPATLLAEIRNGSAPVALFEFLDDVGAAVVTDAHPVSYPFRDRHPLLCLLELECPTAGSRDEAVQLLEQLLEMDIVRDIVIAESVAQRNNLFALRERIGETLNRTRIVHKNDISVPLASVGRFCLEARALTARAVPGALLTLFGHVGDGNVHVNIIKPDTMEKESFFALCENLDSEIFDLVRRLGGSVSAEHGVGLLKKPFLHYTRSSNEISIMREIKRIFDPDGILNPGKIF